MSIALYTKRLAWLALLSVCGSPGAAAQQAEDLQQQLQQLKQQYEQTTRALQQQIDALQQQLDKQKQTDTKQAQSTVTAAELAAEQAAKKAVLGQSDQVGAQFQGQVPAQPTYDFLRDAETKIEGL